VRTGCRRWSFLLTRLTSSASACRTGRGWVAECSNDRGPLACAVLVRVERALDHEETIAQLVHAASSKYPGERGTGNGRGVTVLREGDGRRP
jgi:hypothetical protein